MIWELKYLLVYTWHLGSKLEFNTISHLTPNDEGNLTEILRLTQTILSGMEWCNTD